MVLRNQIMTWRLHKLYHQYHQFEFYTIFILTSVLFCNIRQLGHVVPETRVCNSFRFELKNWIEHTINSSHFSQCELYFYTVLQKQNLYNWTCWICFTNYRRFAFILRNKFKLMMSTKRIWYSGLYFYFRQYRKMITVLIWYMQYVIEESTLSVW